MEKIEVLWKCDVFRNLSDAQLQVIERICTSKVFKPGEIICEQDATGENLYVIEEGLAGIILELGPLSQRQVQAASSFDAVDWSAVIEPYVCTATVKAIEKTKALVINGKELTDLCNTYPEIGCKVSRGIARVVATRLRYAYAQLLGVTLTDET